MCLWVYLYLLTANIIWSQHWWSHIECLLIHIHHENDHYKVKKTKQTKCDQTLRRGPGRFKRISSHRFLSVRIRNEIHSYSCKSCIREWMSWVGFLASRPQLSKGAKLLCRNGMYCYTCEIFGGEQPRPGCSWLNLVHSGLGAVVCWRIWLHHTR